MTHPVEAAAKRTPNAILVQTPHTQLTAAQLQGAVAQCAGRLRQSGVGVGDTVAIHGLPSADWLVALHAVGWLGAVAAPLPPKEPVAPYLSALKPSMVLTDGHTPIAHPHQLMLAGPGAAPCPPTATSKDQPSLMLCTSGTTGRPRAVTLTWGQLDAAAQASQEHLGHRADDAWLGCLPLHHIGGLSVFLRTVRYGTCGILHTHFDAERVGAALDSGEVTQVSLVPAMLDAILDTRPAQPFHSRLRFLLIGGAPMGPALMERCRALQLPVALSWGMTETTAQVATRQPGDLRAAPDVGHPLPGLAVHSHDGFLAVTGPTAPGGSWTTSDRGTLDAQGRVIVWGRGTDLIISGGENIDPREIELVLEAHPSIAEAAVVGRPHSRWGERPVAFVTAQGDAQPTLQAIQAHVCAGLPSFKAPDDIFWVNALPRGPLGKLRRSALVDQLQASQRIKED